MYLSTTISQRDRRLLTLVGVFGIAALSLRFLILPAWERGQELTEQIDGATALREERRIQLHELDYLDAAIERQRALREKAAAPYYGILTNWEIDDRITALLLAHGLFPEELSLTGAALGLPQPYLYAVKTPAEASEETPAEGAVSYVYLGTAELAATGELEQWQGFLDEVEADPSLRLLRFAVNEERYVTAGEETVTAQRIDCTIEIYMCGEEDAP